MKKKLKKTLKSVLILSLCIVMVIGSAPLSGFVGLELPEFPNFNLGFLKASAASEVSDDEIFYISPNDKYKTVSITGLANIDLFEGVLGSNGVSGTIAYKGEEYTITAIGSSAFSETKITTITIPASVTTIGSSAFSGCTALQAVKFEDREEIETLTIGGWCFSDCSNLKEIELEKSNVVELVGATFMDCTALDNVVLPNTLVKVGGGVFHGCKTLSNVTLSENMTALNDYGLLTETYFFYGCKKLTGITIPAKIKTIGTKAFYGSGLENIIFSTGSELTEISDSAFNGTPITSITIPASVTTIGSSAFAGCKGLTDVCFDERGKEGTLLVLDNWVFSECKALTDINFEKSNATKVGVETFSNCTSLEKIVLPDTLKKSGRGMFYNCTSLNDVDLGSGITDLYGFGEASNTSKGFFENCTNLVSITIPNQIVNLEHRTFMGCKNLKIVTFGDESQLVSIGGKRSWSFGTTDVGYVFYGCEVLEEISIPSTVTSIGVYSFAGCQSLKIISMPSNLNYIGSNAFSGSTSLEKVMFEDRGENGESLVLGNSVFSGCVNLKNINFQVSNVSKVGTETFLNCTSLEKIILPNTLKESGEGMFYGCTSLQEVNLGTGITKLLGRGFGGVGKGFFEKCTNLKYIKIPAQVTVLGQNAFKDCTSLESIQFAKGSQLEYIGGYSSDYSGNVFEGCKSLKSIKIPATVTTIGIAAFYYCENLETVIFEEGVLKLRSISNTSFDTSKTNVSITIPCEDSDLAVRLIDYGILYKAKETGMKDDGTRNVDINKTSYSSSTSKITASNVVNLKLNYSFKNDVEENIAPKRLIIKIPQNTSLYSSTIKINGNSQTVSVNGNQIVLNITEDKAEIQFAIKLTNTRHLISYAKIEYEISGKTKTELLGIVNIGRNLLTVEAPSLTSQKTISVHGYTSPESTVAVYVDGKYITSTVSSKSGNYSNDITLENPEHKKTYKISASSGTKNANTYVQYNEESVDVTEAKMYFNGTEYDMLSQEGTSPRIGWSYSPFTFKVKTNNDKAVKYIAIVSRKGSEIKTLEMHYDDLNKVFVSSGFTGYVPGTLSVRIIDLAGKEILVDNFLKINELSEEEIANKTEVKVNNNTFSENTVEGSLDADVMVEGTKIVNISAEQNICAENISHDELIESGYVQATDNDGNAVYSKIEFNKEKAEVYVHSYRFCESTSLYTCSDNGLESIGKYSLDTILKLDFEEKGIFSGEEIELIELVNTIKDLFGDIEGISERVSLFIEYVEYAGKQISQEDLTAEQRFEKFNHLLEFCMFYSFGIKLEIISKGLVYAYDAVFVTSMETIGLDFFAGLVSAWVAGGLEEAFDEDGDASTEGYYTVCDHLYEFYFGKSFFEEEIKINPIKEIGSVDYSFIIDPSGYVYEAVPSNRLSGVKTTIYYSSNSDGGNAIVWDASEYDQANPIYTDKNGCYAWDVPEGYWQVKYEKLGYETTYSEWLPVPPPQLEVNQALISTQKPTVDFVNVSSDKIELAFNQYVNIDTVSLQNVVVTDSYGNIIEGDVTPTSNENGLSKRYIIVPDRSLYGKVTLSFSANIKSYNDKNLDAIVVIRDVNVLVESIETKEEFFATINESKTIFIKANPLNSAYKKELSINIIDRNIAELISEDVCFDNEGIAAIEIKALLPGKTDIEICVEGTSVRKVVSFVVSATESAPDKPMDISSISIETNNQTIVAGETKVLVVRAEPKHIEPSDLVWCSNDENIAKVNGNGVVTAVSKGTVTITVSTEDGKISSSCTLLVLPKKYSVIWNVEGIRDLQEYEYGENIILPPEPQKTSYKFSGWTPAVPETMPAYDLTFTAVFEPIATSTNVQINRGVYVGEAKPGATITIKAEQIGGKIFKQWIVEGATVADANSAETTVALGNGDVTITAEYDDCDCKCHQGGIIGFFFKIVLFFQKIFGKNVECICGAKH